MEVYATVAKHYEVDGHVVVRDRDEVVFSDFPSRDATLNVINLALAYGELKDEGQDQVDYRCTVEIHKGKEKRFLEELNILAKKGASLGAVGYVLGLHSSVFVAVDSKNKQKIERGNDLYYALWQGTHFTTGTYMPASLHKSVVDEGKIPEDSKLFEDYIFVRQLGRKVEIPDAVYEQLLSELVEMYRNPIHLFYSRKAIRFVTKRFVGMIPGILVQHGLKEGVAKVSGMLCAGALAERVPPELLKVWDEAVDAGRRLGDL